MMVHGDEPVSSSRAHTTVSRSLFADRQPTSLPHVESLQPPSADRTISEEVDALSWPMQHTGNNILPGSVSKEPVSHLLKQGNAYGENNHVDIPHTENIEFHTDNSAKTSTQRTHKTWASDTTPATETVPTQRRHVRQRKVLSKF